MINPALLWVTASLGIYVLMQMILRKVRTTVIAPVQVTIVILIVILLVTGTDYHTYMEGGRLISFFLGPSVVALGIPLYRNLTSLGKSAASIGSAVIAGTVAGVLGAIVPAMMLGLPDLISRSLAPKSITTPIAISLSESLGGDPSLAAVFVVVTGLFGAVLGPVLMKLVGIRHPVAWGLAMGTAAHGVGTSIALEHDPTSGAAAGLGICLCGIATSALAPVLVRLVLG
jgi:predicted murein hydrolase (TIGR00659 family)